MIASLTPRALRSRWAVQRLASHASHADCPRVHVHAGPESRVGNHHAPPSATAPVEAMGLRFASPLLLAAGFDRTGRLLAEAAALGVGGVETGSHRVPASGHLPRIRLAAMRDPAPDTIARPCHGLSLLVPGVDGAGPAASAARLRAALAGWQAVADYAVLNPGRSGATPAHCVELLAALAELRDRLPRTRRLALVAKMPAVWMERAEASTWARRLVEAGADGLLVSAEGAPERAGERLAALVDAVGAEVCLISVGGVDSVRVAAARLAAGARLVQLHRALLAAPERVLPLLAGIAALGCPGRLRTPRSR